MIVLAANSSSAEQSSKKTRSHHFTVISRDRLREESLKKKKIYRFKCFSLYDRFPWCIAIDSNQSSLLFLIHHGEFHRYWRGAVEIFWGVQEFPVHLWPPGKNRPHFNVCDYIRIGPGGEFPYSTYGVLKKKYPEKHHKFLPCQFSSGGSIGWVLLNKLFWSI